MDSTYVKHAASGCFLARHNSAVCLLVLLIHGVLSHRCAQDCVNFICDAPEVKAISFVGSNKVATYSIVWG
jgi:hypothetical protein